MIFTRLALESRKEIWAPWWGKPRPIHGVPRSSLRLAGLLCFTLYPSTTAGAGKSTAPCLLRAEEPCPGSPSPRARPVSWDSPGSPFESQGNMYGRFGLRTMQMPISTLFYTTHRPFFHHCSHFRPLVGSTRCFLHQGWLPTLKTGSNPTPLSPGNAVFTLLFPC